MTEYIVADIGKRIKNVRQEKGLKLTEVANRAGVSKGLISRIEHGRTIPSLPVLISIVTGMEMQMGDFFQGLNHGPEQRYIHLKQQEYSEIRKENASGFLYQSILNKSFGDTLIEAVLLTIQPQATRNYVTTDAWEFKYMVAGEVEYDLDGDIISLKEGDSFFYNGRIPHVPRNNGSSNAVMLVLYFFDKQV